MQNYDTQQSGRAAKLTVGSRLWGRCRKLPELFGLAECPGASGGLQPYISKNGMLDKSWRATREAFALQLQLQAGLTKRLAPDRPRCARRDILRRSAAKAAHPSTVWPCWSLNQAQTT
jgi:hypothetical protein